jgi:hypothetical protein
MISYGGVFLPSPTADDVARVRAAVDPARLWEFELRLAPPPPAASGTALPARSWLPGPVELGRLTWPYGAARWAFAHYLCDSASLSIIRAAAYAGGALAPLPLVLDDGTRSVTTSLYLLPARPLDQCDSGPGFHLLTLVDARYFWWFQAAVITITEGTTAWADLYGAVGSALGVTINYDQIPTAYLKPPAALAVSYGPLSLLLDAVADSVGQRIVRRLDGTVLARNAVNGAAQLSANLGAGWPKRAGGTMALQSGAANDLGAVLPASVTVAFPRADAAVPATPDHPVAVTLASLALPEAAGVTGFSGSRPVRSSALYGGANATELATLATQIATDWYRFQLGRHDVAYNFVAPWVPDSLTDVLEFTDLDGEWQTRAVRGVWDDWPVQLYHLSSAGSADPWALTVTDGTATYDDVGTLVIGTGLALSRPGTGAAQIAAKTQLSVTTDAAGLKLVNDVSAPGASYYYGTDPTGAKGWYPLPATTTSAVWRYSTNNTMADPGSGQYRTGSGTFSGTTQIAIDVITNGGVDFTNTLKTLLAGDIIEIQDQGNSANWARYTLSANPTNNTGWFLLPVAWHSGGGAAPNNNTPCVFTFTMTGGGGGAGGTGTVTSFSAGNLAPLFTTAVATPTTTPALSFTLNNQTAATVFAGPTSGSPASLPTFRALIVTDLPTVDIPHGGTGQITANAAFNALAPAQAGHATQFLRTDGANTSWQAPPAQVFTTTSGLWNFSTSTSTTTDPGSGNIAFDSATAAGVANLIVSRYPVTGIDGIYYLSSLNLGDSVYVEDRAVVNTWYRFDVNGPATLSANSFFVVPVKLHPGTSYGVTTVPAAGATMLVEFFLPATDGTVTSVALSTSAASDLLAVGGSPITTAGTLTLGKVSQPARYTYIAPSGAAGVPTFRLLVAADIPGLDASQITTGVFAVARGGTGASTANLAFNNLAPAQSGHTNQFLMTDGTNTSWAAPGAASPTTVSGLWNFDTSTVSSDPGSGVVRFNSATMSSVTALYLAGVPVAGFDIRGAGVSMGVGDSIYVQITNNFSYWYRFDIVGTPTDNVTWLSVPVRLRSEGVAGVPAAGSLLMFDFCLPTLSISTGPVGAVQLADGNGGFTPITSPYTFQWQSTGRLLLIDGVSVRANIPQGQTFVLAGPTGNILGYDTTGYVNVGIAGQYTDCGGGGAGSTTRLNCRTLVIGDPTLAAYTAVGGTDRVGNVFYQGILTALGAGAALTRSATLWYGAGTVGTAVGWQDLYVPTVPANTCTANGDTIGGHFGGLSGGTAGRQIRLMVNGTIVYDSGAFTSTGASFAWMIDFFIVRADAANGVVTATFRYGSTGGVTGLSGGVTALTVAIPWTGTFTVECYVYVNAVNDIIGTLSHGRLLSTN